MRTKPILIYQIILFINLSLHVFLIIIHILISLCFLLLKRFRITSERIRILIYVTIITLIIIITVLALLIYPLWYPLTRLNTDLSKWLFRGIFIISFIYILTTIVVKHNITASLLNRIFIALGSRVIDLCQCVMHFFLYDFSLIYKFNFFFHLLVVLQAIQMTFVRLFLYYFFYELAFVCYVTSCLANVAV